jgi:hypothetical protein
VFDWYDCRKELALRDHHSGMSLTDGQLTHQAQSHQLLSRTFLCIAVTQVPTSCLVWRSNPALVLFVIAGWSLAGWMIRLFCSGEVIFFVADHFQASPCTICSGSQSLYWKMSVDVSLLKKNLYVLRNATCAPQLLQAPPISVTAHLGCPVCLD